MKGIAPLLPNLNDMAEATRLTQEGQLMEATALIQRSFFGWDTNAGAPQATGQAASATIADGSAHELNLPEKLRGLVDWLRQGTGAGAAPSAERVDPSPVRGRESEPPPEPMEDPGEQRESGFVERAFSNACGARSYKLYIPDDAGPRPLVIMLHGCTQSPDDFAAGTGMNALAEAEGFFVAYPAQTQSANPQKCWNWFEPTGQQRESGEAGIIAGITREIMAEQAIDPARVYIAGMSAGGAAAANIARLYPDLYAAVGIHSGLPAGCALDLPTALAAMNNGGVAKAGQPGASLPTIVFHGANDMTVNPANGAEIVAQAGTEGLSIEQEAGEAGHRYVRTRYRDADGRVRVESWLVEGAGHAWSGGSAAGSYADPKGPDASQAMIDFFRGHQLAARS